MDIIPEAKKPLEQFSTDEKKRLAHEQEYLVDQMGQDSETAAKSVVEEYVKSLNKREKKRWDDDLDQLKILSRDRNKYFNYLASVVVRFTDDENIPPRYHMFIDLTDEGLIVSIQHTNLYRAFKVSGVPFYDMNACKILAMQVGNTIAKLEGHVNRSKGGIIIPDALDKKKYGSTKSRTS